MPRQLPPINALKAFEAAARHESFTRAAEELCVTQGAVSHQVKALEAELGLKLFNREHQRLIITEGGRAYLAVVRDAFDRIADGTQRLLQPERRRAHREHLAEFCREVAGPSPGPLRRSPSRDRSQGQRFVTAHRFRTRGYRSGDPPQ